METTKEKILEAAKRCSEAKETLKILFPEAFEDEIFINIRMLAIEGTSASIFSKENCIRANVHDDLREVRTSGEYRNKAFYLNDVDYDWEMKKDSTGSTVLIPTKR
jgi:hypothetical protein